MASTNKTANYNLSQYVGTDKPTYLGDYNSDMSKIDAQMKANNEAIAINSSQIETIEQSAQSALQTAQSAQSKADSADGTASSALEKALSNETEISKLKDVCVGSFGLTDQLTLTINGYTNVPINKIHNLVGNKLSLGNGGIVIGTGVSKVKISSNLILRAQPGNNTAKNLDILVNDTEVMLNQNTYTSSIQTNFTMSLSPQVINVSEGDVIKCRVYGTTNDFVYHHPFRTYITVEVIG